MWAFSAKKADRLDRALREQGKTLPGGEWLSRQAWDWLLEHGQVAVNGRKVTKAGSEIPAGAEIQVSVPGGRLGLLPGPREARLLWSSADQSLALFSKDCGLDSHPLLPWDASTFANEVAAYAEKNLLDAVAFARLAEPPRLEGGLLQRLDRDTSGILAVAFTVGAKSLFRQLFSGGKMEKTYHAIVSGDLSRLGGEHRFWLGSGGGPKVRAHLSAPKGESEEARLSIEINNEAGGRALLKVTTRQGSRHVVRASLAALGAPLVGDQTYGGGAGAPFHQLHASALRLLEPQQFAEFPNHLRLPPPESFLDSLAGLGLHWRE